MSRIVSSLFSLVLNSSKSHFDMPEMTNTLMCGVNVCESFLCSCVTIVYFTCTYDVRTNTWSQSQSQIGEADTNVRVNNNNTNDNLLFLLFAFCVERNFVLF